MSEPPSAPVDQARAYYRALDAGDYDLLGFIHDKCGIINDHGQDDQGRYAHYFDVLGFHILFTFLKKSVLKHALPHVQQGQDIFLV